MKRQINLEVSAELHERIQKTSISQDDLEKALAKGLALLQCSDTNELDVPEHDSGEPDLKMTTGEKMVWAAVYAREFIRLSSSSLNAAANASVHAAHAVGRLRNAESGLNDAIGSESDAYKLYMEMTDTPE